MLRRSAQLRLLLALAVFRPVGLVAQTPSLYAQTLRIALLGGAIHTQAQPEILLLDLRNGEMLVDDFKDSAAPMPPGSLLKPFLALAWLQSHTQASSRTFVCRGAPDRCWRASGHGSLTLPQALAQSCNAYFLALAAEIDPARIPYLPTPPPAATPATLIGLTSDWRISPRTLLRSYASLLTESRSGPSSVIREGLASAATSGTASHLGAHAGGVLAKTGTAPCIEPRCLASGDGLVLAAVPALQPRLLLLVRRRGTTGSAAAADAGRLLGRLEALHAY